MSIAVELHEVRDAAARQAPFAYLMTVTDDERVHLVAIAPRISEEHIECDAGGSTLRNATARPSLSLVWPPGEDGGYSLIVDGDATVSDGTVVVIPTRAVLHRPAAGADPKGPERHDCAPVSIGE